MKYHPIIFSGEMVRAILDGKKTQTRRVVKFIDRRRLYPGGSEIRCPYGQPGDRLWIREAWATVKWYDHLKPSAIPMGDDRWPTVWYNSHPRAAASIALNKFDDDSPVGKTRPSIHMPRWASRITLEVVSVRVDLVQAITGSDVLAEGVDNGKSNPAMGERWENMQRMAFSELWNSINKKRGHAWESNPWVWVVEFRTVEKEPNP